ncbi:unnamed protein product [Brachionus calyciflorus]|uniref:Transient receptor potential cation channel subfamily A member 1 n=1 Tax=Brachionus calyciflorus TaxID=104777 RepID=A0A813W9U0_9BILA|nr:unnamed protein product [Brachionus calyciflorus]
MNICIQFKNDLINKFKKSDEADIGNQELAYAPNYMIAYKNDLFQLTKDAEDLNKTDEYLIEALKALDLPDELKPMLKDFQTGYDNSTLLHVGAKFCRKKFCEFLLKEYFFDKDIFTKSKLTPLQVLIKYNTIQKWTDQLMNDESYVHKREVLLDTFKLFIDHGSNVNNQDENGYTTLHYAALKNSYEIAFKLVNLSGIKISIEDKKQFTPLHVALKYDSNDVALLLIDYTPPEKLACYKIPNAIMPIHLACKSKEEKLEIVRKILYKLKQESTNEKNYLDYVLKKEDSNRQPVVFIAINNNHLDIVETLYKEFNLDRELKEGKLGNLAVHAGAKNGSVKILDILAKNDAISFGQNNNLDNALHIATENNSVKFIKEFIIYEKNMLNRVETDRNYFCACICSVGSHTPSVRVRNKKLFTPLMSALVHGNHKCVEELLVNSQDIELDTKDVEGNTFYHLCAQFNNLESLKYFLQKYFHQTNEVLFFRNCQDDTVLHVACRFGNLEVIKMLLQKIYDTNTPADSLLYSQNMNGQTCFHLACIRGYFNIVEYFLRDRKLTQFLEHVDNNSNTCLHLATKHGHASIVTLLLDYGADVTSKNEDNLTSLDLSCRLGFFEISKIIIHKYSKMSESQTALHTAALEGAHEVVKLLLMKGAVVNKLDENRQNCLGLAISRSQSEVVKVLLHDPNWSKLIRLNNFEDSFVEDTISIVTESEPASVRSEKQQPKFVENPELYAMFENKMWDNFKIVLDRCIEDEKIIDFSKIDMPVENLAKHPLMLVARSGQEDLLKHKTVSLLLHLKWRLIPRSAFYISILFYLFFLVLLSLYSLELANAGAEFYRKEIGLNSTDIDEKDGFNLNDIDEDLTYYTDNPVLFYFLIVTLTVCILKEILQFMLLDGFAYFFYLQNLIELLTYALGFMSIFTTNFSNKSAYASISVLLAFLIFPLHVQKLRIFGVYVVAFCRTLMNSAKFFPIFIIIYCGFLLSLRIRSNFGVSYFDSTVFSLVRTLTMVTGELETAKMGLTDDIGALPNYIIYFLFIGLMCTILINLFVGIAVGEIKTVLDEADIQQISMRIMFVLKVQSALQPFRRTIIGKYLNMTYEKYDKTKESNVYRIFYKLWIKFSHVLSSKDPEIKLLDPQKRLEDSFIEMSKNTSEQIKSIKALFNNQVSDVETKLNNSSVRVEDGINEMARNTTSYLENLIDDLNNSSKNLLLRLEKAESKLDSTIGKLSIKVMDELTSSKIYFDDKLNQIEKRLTEMMIESKKDLGIKLGSMEGKVEKCFVDLEEAYKKSDAKILEQIDETTEFLHKELKELKFESIEVTKYETNRLQVNLRNVHETVNFIGTKINEINSRRF